jgi:hypothetical protein
MTMEMRWLVLPGPRKDAICLSGECRVLQFRLVERWENHNLGLFPVWSEWQDIPTEHGK